MPLDNPTPCCMLRSLEQWSTAVAKQYQIIQERYADDWDSEPTQDDFPVLFASIEEARERASKDGLGSLFEHKNNVLGYHIVELTTYRDGVTYTGRQFPL